MTNLQKFSKFLATENVNNKTAMIKSAEFRDAWRELASTRKIAEIEADILRKNIRKLQYLRERYNIKSVEKNLAERYAIKQRTKWENYIVRNLNTPVHGQLILSFDADYNYSINQYQIWEKYGRKNFPILYTNRRISIPSIHCNPPHISSFDSLVNLRCELVRTIGTVVLYSATWLTPGRGFTATLSNGFIAVAGSVSYHADNPDNAIRGLHHKIRRRESRLTLTLDSYLSVTKYMRLTGACERGCLDFCTANNLDPGKKYRVREILPLLEMTNTYGVGKLRSALR
jgi:hypothetical protein